MSIDSSRIVQGQAQVNHPFQFYAGHQRQSASVGDVLGASLHSLETRVGIHSAGAVRANTLKRWTKCTGAVRAHTLKRWIKCVLHIAKDEVIGQASIGTGRNPEAFNGKALDGSDGLKAVLMGNTHPILVGKLKLNRFSRSIELYGPEEMVIVAKQIDEKILAQPSRASTWVQSKAQHQLLLSVGGRTCTVAVAGQDGVAAELDEFSHDDDDDDEFSAGAYIREKDVRIEQTERNAYDLLSTAPPY